MSTGSNFAQFVASMAGMETATRALTAALQKQQQSSSSAPSVIASIKGKGFVAWAGNATGRLIGAASHFSRRNTVGATGGWFEKEGAGLRTAGGAISGTLGMAAGIAGGVATAVGAVVASFQKLNQVTEETIAENKKYAMVSASMSQVMAQREFEEMMRDQKKGDVLAGSAAALVKAEQERKDAQAPFEVGWLDFKNNVMTGLNKAGTAVLKGVGDLAEAVGIVNDIRDLMPQKPNDGTMTVPEFMAWVNQQHEEARKRNPMFNRGFGN